MERIDNPSFSHLLHERRAVRKTGIAECEKTIISDDHLEHQLKFILENLTKTQPVLTKVALPHNEALHFVPIKDIIRCEAIVGYTNIHTSGGHKYTCSKTVKEYEELLPTSTFFRVHSSHLINLNLIKKYYKGRGGYVEMEDGSIIEVANRRKDQFLACFYA